MANLVFNSFKKALLDADIDFNTDTFKVALVTSAYSPNQDSHDNFDDVTSEVSAVGYTAGGATLTGVSTNQDNVDNVAWLDANDASWTSSSITARAAVVYKSTGTASTSKLICYIDFGSDKVSESGTFTIQWPAEGIFELTD